MKRFQLSFLFVLAALGIAAVGSASLSALSFSRRVDGQVAIDTADDVAIQITAKDSAYKELIRTDENGKVSIDLNKAIDKNFSRGFNTDAVFGIGSLQSGVILIKNNSDTAVVVESGKDSMVEILAANNTTEVIKPGEASEFSFLLNTKDLTQGKGINSTIQIKRYT
jgi:hypothetical protein